MKTLWDIADEVIEKAYPDFYSKGKGWWGAKRIQNWGTLRGAIVIALKDASQSTVEASTAK